MSRRTALTAHLAAALAAAFIAAPAYAQPGWGIRSITFQEVIERVTRMPYDQELQARAGQLGLNVVNLTWEDTARNGGSSVGPNISDLTLQVREKDGQGQVRTHLLPVIRHPNFSDKTADVPLDDLWVRVGNQTQGGHKVARPMREVLSNLKEYLSDPSSLNGSDNFIAPRDTHVLVSAQHVFLPIPPGTNGGKVEFNPVLFNYQSSAGHPAVLTLLVTREGTSATIIDNAGGDQSYQGWGQQLFFNNAGQKTVFTAERKSSVKARIEAGQATAGDAGALEEGADMMMIVQVPLKVNRPRREYFGAEDYEMAPSAAGAAAEAAPMAKASRRRGSDVEQAVLGHGDDQGPFRELAGMRIERDPRFPIRVTVQFYKATSNGIVDEQNLADVNQAIQKVYESGDYVGSLVVPKGERTRPTDWIKDRAPRLGFVY
ncbi:MAG: hypothetical protein KC933_12815 [Myxococcales bacterium]|nr:hypothetical protein [Myxococcales bacterium]MCB9647507.1 hypothetical protein [Deltaproteobacteria bacterium]